MPTDRVPAAHDPDVRRPPPRDNASIEVMVNWVRIASAKTQRDADHFVDTNERFRIAVARQ